MVARAGAETAGPCTGSALPIPRQRFPSRRQLRRSYSDASSPRRR